MNEQLEELFTAATRSPPSARAESTDFLNSETILAALRRGETGDAELFRELYRDRVVYDHSEKHWFLWSGRFWQEDRKRFVNRLISTLVAAQYLSEAANQRAGGADKALIKALTKRSNALQGRNRIRNVLDLAQSELACTAEVWDTDPMLLTCENEVIDLKDGESFEGQPADYLRTVCPVAWRGLEFPARRWESFLLEIFNLDTELIEFTQRLLGYALVGKCTEHVLPILWGEGRNGKDVLLQTLKNVLGPFADPASQKIFIADGRSSEGATPERYALREKRLIWVSETREGARLNTGLVKLLTGGGIITARPLYGRPVSFQPGYLPLLVTNHKPHAPADDYALWQRLLLIPFTQKFVDDPDPTIENEHQCDPDLIEELKTEASGILAWLVRGCLEWQHKRLQPPATVKVATAEYRDEEDVLGHFLDDRCTLDASHQVKASAFYRAYKDWIDENGMGRGMSLTAFGKRMARRFEKVKTMHGAFYHGVGLSIDQETFL